MTQIVPSRYILIWFYHLCLGLQNDLFLSGFATMQLYAFLLSPMHATHPDLLIQNLNSFSLLNVFYRLVNSFLLTQDIFLNTLPSNTLRIHAYCNVRDKFTHIQHTKIQFHTLYFNRNVSRWRKQRLNIPGQNGNRHFLTLNCSYFLHACNFDLVVFLSNVGIFHILKGFISNLCAVILSCILLARHKHILSFS
jgi:hypothetical protein